MKLAFCLYKYFPFGGLQRDFMRIANECYARGHSIRVYTLSWQGEKPAFMDVIIVPSKAIQNHVMYRRYSEWAENHLQKNPVDGVVGFNKMPNLDVYYAADPCYVAKAHQLRNWLYRLGGRFKHFYHYEESVFGGQAKAHSLLISEVQKPLFEQFYHTPEARLHLLPPGIARDRIAPSNADEIRHEFRKDFKLAEYDILLLMVGSGFKTKGLDRTLHAMASLPEETKIKTQLIVIGQDNPVSFIKMAQRLNLHNQVHILAGRDDIPRFLLGANILLHPAYSENTGTVLLEAVVAGLPVIASDVCGYAHYIVEAGAGELVESPFNQNNFNQQVFDLISNANRRQQYQQAGLAFAKTADIFNMPQYAVDVIEQVVKARD